MPDHPTTSPIRFRRTRIAVSVFFGMLTVALCMLWVRSYWTLDNVWFRAPGHNCSLTLMDGTIDLYCLRESAADSVVEFDWATEPIDRTSFGGIAGEKTSECPPEYHDGETYLSVPFWFPVLSTSVMLVLISTLRRFSLRTMFIAVTLVAVALGLVVWTIN